MTDLDKITAQKIIQALGTGATPTVGLEYISVGRAFWLEAINKFYLNDFIRQDGSAVKFLKGDYGSGKTHFLNLMREEAFRRDYVVSLVTLKSREAPFNKFEIIYQKIINGLSTKTKPDGDALKHILDKWYRDVYEQFASRFKDRILDEPRIKAELEYKVFELAMLDGIDSDFRNALKAYFQNMLEAKSSRDEENTIILDWIRGKEIPKPELRKFQIFSRINKQNSKEMMKSLVRALVFFGYTGLIILLDEAESIPSIMRSKDRDQAYDNIRELMDNTDGRGKGGTNKCMFVYATTPTFFESREGIKTYPALYQRVKDELKDQFQLTRVRNPRATIIDLEQDPLKFDEMLEIAKRIRTIHSVAFDWKPSTKVSDDTLKEYVNFLDSQNLTTDISKPRILVKSVTQLLDICMQDESFDPKKHIDQLLRDSIIALNRQREQEEQEISED